MISALVGTVYPLGFVICPGHPVEGYGVGVNGGAWAIDSGFRPQSHHPGPRRRCPSPPRSSLAPLPRHARAGGVGGAPPTSPKNKSRRSASPR